MPCESGPTYEDLQREAERLDVMARLACLYCTELEETQRPIPKWAKSWWKEHQEEDAAREERQDEERGRKRLRSSGLKKLSAAERKALGL